MTDDPHQPDAPPPTADDFSTAPAAAPQDASPEAPRSPAERRIAAPPPRSPSRREQRRLAKRRRRRRGNSPFIVALDSAVTLLVLALLAVLAGYYMVAHELSAPGPLAQAKAVIIPKGAGSRDMGQLLENNGVIDNHWMFVAGVETAGDRGKLKAGEYLIPAHASIREIVALIASGKVMEHPITIPEGLTSEQIVDRLRAEPVLSGQIDAIPPEGSLLPETYNVPRGTSRQALLATMAEKDKDLVEKIWDNRKPGLPLTSREQLVTLASIVEKETGVASERPLVAAVFINRLRKGMRLQSDPTTIYGLVGGKGSLGRPLTRDDLETQNRYNTYVIRGLPPGPITNPGRASLEAAAHPANTNDLYFVADGSGGHAFAATLAAHHRNVEHLREIEAARGEDVSPGALAGSDADDAPARPASRRRR
jgi:UPF0755 protein